MSDPIRYGVVGLAGRGSSHAGYAEDADGAELVAGSDVVEEYVDEFTDDYGVAGYTDHEEMFAEEDLDAISIATPSGLHSEIAISAAEAGVSSMVEKPLDVYLDRVDAMIEAADENDVKLACIFQRRFTPERWTAKQWVEDGKFGDMILADTTVKWYRSQDYYQDSWHGSRDMDGGVLMQQAVHFVDMIQWLMGGVDSVYANADALSHEMECEDTAVVNLEFENGAYGVIEATTSVKGGEDRVELNGTEGSYNSGTFVLDGDEVEPDYEEPPITGSAGQVQDFVEAIREDRDPIVDGHEARKAVEVVLAAYASANLDRKVDVDEVEDLQEHT